MTMLCVIEEWVEGEDKIQQMADLQNRALPFASMTTKEINDLSPPGPTLAWDKDVQKLKIYNPATKGWEQLSTN